MTDCIDMPSLLIYALRQASEAAARAAYEWIGRGEKSRSDRAAVTAMHRALDLLPISGAVMLGDLKGEESDALGVGTRVGRGEGPVAYDVAIDPVEGTSYLAKGQTNAMAVIAMAPAGTLYRPGPAFYMEKFAAPPKAKGKIDPKAPLEEKLRALAQALGKSVKDLTVFVLEKPRHNELVDRIHSVGARIQLYPAGDIAGAVMASIPESGIDALIGTGGTPEGILSACAIRALGGEFWARLDPQLPSEIQAVKKAGLDTEEWLSLETLVASPDVYFAATGITTGLLFEGVEPRQGAQRTQTMLISGLTGERQLLTTYHPTAEAGADA